MYNIKLLTKQIKELYKAIVICGGNSMTKGFPERVENEIMNIVP